MSLKYPGPWYVSGHWVVLRDISASGTESPSLERVAYALNTYPDLLRALDAIRDVATEAGLTDHERAAKMARLAEAAINKAVQS